MRFKGFFFLRLLAMLLVGLPLFGLAVLYLWNGLMPAIFGLRAITFWQALGLMALSWILFRGPRMGRGFGGPRGWMMKRRWEMMTPEQREEMRRKWQARCGGVVDGTPAPQA
jgi:hypothetical protein